MYIIQSTEISGQTCTNPFETHHIVSNQRYAKSMTRQLLKAIMETEKHLKKDHRHERVSETQNINPRLEDARHIFQPPNCTQYILWWPRLRLKITGKENKLLCILSSGLSGTIFSKEQNKVDNGLTHRPQTCCNLHTPGQCQIRSDESMAVVH